jgi:hypothetical protein
MPMKHNEIDERNRNKSFQKTNSRGMKRNKDSMKTHERKGKQLENKLTYVIHGNKTYY